MDGYRSNRAGAATTRSKGPSALLTTRLLARSSFLDAPARAVPVRILPRPQTLERGTCRKDVGVGVAPADNLHPDGEPAREPSGDRRRRMAGEVNKIGKTPADQRINRFSVDGARPDRVAVVGVIH